MGYGFEVVTANKNKIMEFLQTKAKVSIRMLFDVWIAAFSFWNSQGFETLFMKIIP